MNIKLPTFRLLHLRQPVKLNFRARLVYSYLAWRGERGATKRHMAEMLCLNRTTTLTAALNELAPFNLVKREQKKWFAVEPSGDNLKWFVPMSNHKPGLHWSKTYANIPLYYRQPKCPLTQNQVAVYCMIVNLRQRNKMASMERIAKMLCMTRQTVSAAYKKLVALKFVELKNGAPWLLPPPEVTGFRSDMKRKKQPNNLKTLKQPATKEETPVNWIEELAEVVRQADRCHVITPNDVRSFVWLRQEDAQRIGRLIYELYEKTHELAPLVVAFFHAVEDNKWEVYPNPTNFILHRINARATGNTYKQRT